MADRKITQLDENSSLAVGDWFEIVDLGTGDSMKMSASNVLNSALITALGTVVSGNVDAVVSDNIKTKGWAYMHTQSDIAVATGDGKDGFVIPAFMNGMNLVDVTAAVDDKGVTNTTDIQLRRRRDGSEVDMLTVKVTLGDEWSVSDGTINTSNDDLATGDIIYLDVDAVHSGTPPNGLGVVCSARLP